MNRRAVPRIGPGAFHLPVWAALLCAGLLPSLRGAPLPPVGKVAIDGTIERATWEPAQKLNAVKGMSGSAGRDRTLPAHFVVVLKEFSGPSLNQARMMNSVVGAAKSGETNGTMPSRLTIWVNSNDPTYLKPGMRIRISGYTVSGDEGGTWAHHNRVQIRSTPGR
ncbi:MAG TPA: hypothetical protein PK529_08635 [Verrucomicrobiales bacterium]|nr:hypothetical protein [Verrucomicrobiales bacterium]